MHQWQEKTRPLRLERRFEFPSYEMTRQFLDRLGDLCENLERFPDISFGKTYVNLTLQADDDEKEAKFTDLDKELACKIDQLVDL